MADKMLTCRDCRTEFLFSVSEQNFYAEKGFTNAPQRWLGMQDRKEDPFTL